MQILNRLTGAVLVVLLTLVSPINSYSQGEDETKVVEFRGDTLSVELAEIEVKATHSSITTANPPFSLSMVTQNIEATNHSAALTLDDMTGGLPGIWINDRENYALGERLTVRGIGWRAQFGVRGIQIVLDGIPLTTADGQAGLNIVDPMFLNRLELLRGPSSMFWGNSSGGVLYMSSTPPPGAPSMLQARQTAGSYGLIKSDLEFSQNTGDFRINGYASYMEQAGYRDHSEVRLGRAGITGSVNLSPNSRLEYFGAYLSMPESEHPSSLTQEQASEDPTQANASFESINAGKEITQGQLGISYMIDSPAGYLTATAYGTVRDLKNPLPFGIINLDRTLGGGRFTLQNRFDVIEINLGVESKIQRDDRLETENDNGSPGAVVVDQLEKVYNHALFLTGNLTAGNLKLLGSIRYDWIRFDTDAGTPSQSGRRDFQSVSPGIGLNYALPSPSLEFYANLSTGFEAPTTTELVNRPGGGNGFNPGIDPEKTLGLEIGSRGVFRGGALTADIAFYQLWIRDLLFPYQLEANGPTYYRNQGETRHRGIETSLQYRFSAELQAQVTYSLTNTRFIEAQTLDSLSLEGNQVPGIPEHRIAGEFSWKPGKFWISTEVRHVSGYPVNNLNTANNDAYTVVNSRVSYHTVRVSDRATLTPFLAVNNLLDARYNGSVVVNAFGGRYYEPAAGLNWRGGITLQFK